MRYVILSSFLFCSSLLVSQYAYKPGVDPCSGQIIFDGNASTNYRVNEEDYDRFLENHLDTLGTGLNRFVTRDKNKLVKIDVVYCYDKYIHFNAPSADGKRLLVTISFKDTQYVMTPADTFGKVDLKFDIIMNTGKILYGSLPKQAIAPYTKIESIELYHDGRRSQIPNELFEDLINPNTCYADRTIRPMELYWDPTQQVFYLYVFGKVNDSFDANQNPSWAYGSSFASKFIFDHNSVKGRIILPGYHLKLFGWSDCLSFWPF